MIGLLPIAADAFNLYWYLAQGHNPINLAVAVFCIAVGLITALSSS